MYAQLVKESALSPMAPESRAQFTNPWTMRVHEVNDSVLESLMADLLMQRRMKFGLAFLAFAFGLFWVGFKDFGGWQYTLLAYVITGGVTAMPCHAIGSLVVRHLFLREAKGYGLSKSTGLLLLTRAERRARSLRFWKSTKDKVRALCEAVRQWDEAE